MRLTLTARMVLILLAGLMAAQGASLWLQSKERATVVAQARGLRFVDRVAEVVRAFESESVERRSGVIGRLQAADLRIALIPVDQVSRGTPHGQIQSAISARLGGDREIRSSGGGMGMGGGGGMGGGPARTNPTRAVDVRLNDGQWIRITASVEPAAPALPNDLIVQLLITLLTVAAVGILAVRQATRPLHQLAKAADALGQDLDTPPLAEHGSVETRRAAQAFNRMQSRIKRLIDERSRALAAVSHDLRTPLTRLRLRTELVGDEQLRDQMAADLDAMAAMIDSTLDYLRGLRESEPVCRIDINALLHSLVNDAAVLGKKVQLQGVVLAPYAGHLSALRRALQNLIDNAIKYGHTARILVEDDTDALRIAVEDEGLGIPPEELTRVTEPFYRPDASRSHETGGVGLGLSNARDIALKHGGKLVLANRPQGGLSAMLVLPRQEH